MRPLGKAKSKNLKTKSKGVKKTDDKIWLISEHYESESKSNAMFTSRVCIDEQQVVKPTMLLTTLRLSFMYVLPSP